MFDYGTVEIDTKPVENQISPGEGPDLMAREGNNMRDLLVITVVAGLVLGRCRQDRGGSICW
ncbi:MAG: hypothetical protein JJU40_15150 [Rhodobacteraceae bacterium]|nr:hypothetical protein [Paracoccaceae bacterium]